MNLLTLDHTKQPEIFNNSDDEEEDEEDSFHSMKKPKSMEEDEEEEDFSLKDGYLSFSNGDPTPNKGHTHDMLSFTVSPVEGRTKKPTSFSAHVSFSMSSESSIGGSSSISSSRSSNNHVSFSLSSSSSREYSSLTPIKSKTNRKSVSFEGISPLTSEIRRKCVSFEGISPLTNEIRRKSVSFEGISPLSNQVNSKSVSFEGLSPVCQTKVDFELTPVVNSSKKNLLTQSASKRFWFNDGSNLQKEASSRKQISFEGGSPI